MLNSENLPVIITGDFNLTPDQAPIQKMQFHFTDVQKTFLNQILNTELQMVLIQKNQKKRIDYIFIKGLKSKTAKHLYKKTPIGDGLQTTTR